MNLALQTIPLARPATIDRNESYPRLVARLSAMSVKKAHDPYLDIAWDTAENRIEPDDARMRLWPGHALAQTAWYNGLTPAVQTRFGREFTAQVSKYTIGFEAILSRGLLTLAPHLRNGSAEYRYVMHEVVEEARHSMMFQELINRIGADPRPPTGFDQFCDDRIANWGREFPELFFFAVLAGEIFIDQQNRELLRQPKHVVHPIVRRVIQIHVTEEARHVCFAEQYLREHLPACNRLQREAMGWVIPVIFSEANRVIMQPDRRLAREFAIPKTALREAFGPGTEYRRIVAATIEPVRQLCADHGFFQARHARLWRWLGLIA